MPLSHDGAARIPGSRHQRIRVKHLWLLHQWIPLQMFASLLCDLNQTLFGFKQQEWFLLSATEALLVCLLNQHLSERAPNISRVCVCVCVQAFSSCSEWWLLSSCGAWASHCSGFSFCGAQALGVQASVIVELKLLCGIWDLPRLRIELLSLALADRYLTTGPPGKNKITLS